MRSDQVAGHSSSGKTAIGWANGANHGSAELSRASIASSLSSLSSAAWVTAEGDEHTTDDEGTMRSKQPERRGRSFAGRAVAGACLLAAAAAGMALGGCAGSPTYNWAAERAAGYKVGPGDVLRINVWKHEELSQAAVTVRPDGGLSLPLIGDIPANGRTVDEISADIGARLARFYQDKPPVTVQLSEVKSYKVYVLGEVNRGGEFTPNHQISVLQSLALAGGFTRFANTSRIIIVRKDARGERRMPFDFEAVVDRGDLQQNLALQSGDTVIVP